MVRRPERLVEKDSSAASEGQLFALDQIADAGVNAAGFTPGSGVTRVVVWFGDAPGHDPICSAISGLGYDITEASVTAKLIAADIKVVAISTTTGYPDGLDDDPTLSAGDYSVACGVPGGSDEQATRITSATGGSYFTGVGPDEIAEKILKGSLRSRPQSRQCSINVIILRLKYSRRHRW